MRLHPNPDGSFTLGTPPGYTERITAEQLPARLAFYRGLWGRGGKPGQPGPYAQFYTETVAELDRAIRDLKAAQPRKEA